MSDAPDPLSPDIASFLEPERRPLDPPPSAKADVFAHLGATLGFPGGPGPVGSGGAPLVTGRADDGSSAAGRLARRSLIRTLAALVVGGAIGAGVHEVYDGATDRRAEHAQVVARAAPPAAPAASPSVAAEPATPPVTIARAESPPARSEHLSRVEGWERDRELAAERALIEQARSALARDKGAAALAALERHAKEFPRGELKEERESLEVQALVGLERFDEARKVGARFLHRYPRSIFGAVVDEALRAIP